MKSGLSMKRHGSTHAVCRVILFCGIAAMFVGMMGFTHVALLE
jgi:hypothetical protein